MMSINILPKAKKSSIGYKMFLRAIEKKSNDNVKHNIKNTILYQLGFYSKILVLEICLLFIELHYQLIEIK